MPLNQSSYEYFTELSYIEFVHTLKYDGNVLKIELAKEVIEELDLINPNHGLNATSFISPIEIQSDTELMNYYKNDLNVDNQTIKRCRQIISNRRIKYINNHLLKNFAMHPHDEMKEKVNQEFRKIHHLNYTPEMENYLAQLVLSDFLSKVELQSNTIYITLSESTLHKLNQKGVEIYHNSLNFDLEDNIECDKDLAPHLTFDPPLINQILEYLEENKNIWHITQQRDQIEKNLLNTNLKQNKNIKI